MAFNPRTLANLNPYGSLGPAPGPSWLDALNERSRAMNKLFGAKPKPRAATPAAQPPPSDPYVSAEQGVQAIIDAMMERVNAQQQAAREQAQREAEQALARGQALAQGLQALGISSNVQQAFQNAANAQAGLAQGFSGQIRDQAAAQAAEQQRQLSGTGQEAAVRNQGENMGNVQYGVGGFMPSTALNTMAAAFGADAALQPGFAAQFGAIDQARRLADFTNTELPQFDQQRADIAAKAPELFMDMLDRLTPKTTATARSAALRPVKLADGRYVTFDPNTGSYSKPYGPAKTAAASSSTDYQAKRLADGRYVTFDPATGRTVGKPFGVAEQPKKPGQSTSPKLQKGDVGGGWAWFDPRTGKQVSGVYKKTYATGGGGGSKAKPRRVDEGGRTVGRTDGVTPTQARSYKATAYSWAKLWHNQDGKLDLNDDGNLVSLTPKQLLAKLVNEGGVPYDLAVRQMARWTPAARSWLKQGVNPLTGQSTRATTSKQTASFSPQENQAIQVALDAGPGSGAKYVFGAAGPNAYDCSGYTMRMVEQTTGVQLPHQARAQFYDPRGQDVPRNALRPGDLVFFRSSPNGQGDGPPYHVGYYIGNGKYVEYYSRGKPARVSSLSSRGDYMGARRFGGGATV